jgi:predicted Zn-dependent protease
MLLRLALALLTACASMGSIAQTERLDLPDMGASADSILSRKEEEEYARALVRQMRAYEVLVEDPLISGFFEDMGYRLASNSDRPDKSFTFVVLDQPVVNAFAAPGGVIALYTGLILAADDENEVAGVLSHEIAHITQLHLYRALENQQAMTIPIALAMLGLVLAGGGSAEAIQGAVIGGQAAAQQAQIFFTRQNEYEADRIGIATLSRAGYDPAGMGEFFEKMGRITRAMGEGPPEYLRTHPVSVSRIAEADNRAQNMPKPPPSDGKDFYLVQARLRALTEKTPDTALQWFEHRMDRADISQAETDALFYGRAIALQRKGQFDEARKLLRNLLDRESGSPPSTTLSPATTSSRCSTPTLCCTTVIPARPRPPRSCCGSNCWTIHRIRGCTSFTGRRRTWPATRCGPRKRSPSPTTCAAVSTRRPCSSRNWSAVTTWTTTNALESPPASTSYAWNWPSSAWKKTRLK